MVKQGNENIIKSGLMRMKEAEKLNRRHLVGAFILLYMLAIGLSIWSFTKVNPVTGAAVFVIISGVYLYGIIWYLCAYTGNDSGEREQLIVRKKQKDPPLPSIQMMANVIRV